MHPNDTQHAVRDAASALRPVLTVDEVAAFLAVKRRTVLSWIQRPGMLPALRTNRGRGGGSTRILRADVIALLERIRDAGPLTPERSD